METWFLIVQIASAAVMIPSSYSTKDACIQAAEQSVRFNAHGRMPASGQTGPLRLVNDVFCVRGPDSTNKNGS